MSFETFHVDADFYDHEIGNKQCEEGWCGNSWPRPCECGGLVHTDFGNENSDGDYWLYKKCDRCGDDYVCDD